MNTSTSADRHSSSVKDKVADLSEEVVCLYHQLMPPTQFWKQHTLVSIPIHTTIRVWVSIHQSHSLKASGSLDDRKVRSIANELRVVVLD